MAAWIPDDELQSAAVDVLAALAAMARRADADLVVPEPWHLASPDYDRWVTRPARAAGLSEGAYVTELQLQQALNPGDTPPSTNTNTESTTSHDPHPDPTPEPARRSLRSPRPDLRRPRRPVRGPARPRRRD